MPNPHKKQDTACAYAGLACCAAAAITHFATGGHVAVAFFGAFAAFFFICAIRHFTSWGD